MRLIGAFISLRYTPVHIPPDVDTTALASIYDDSIVSEVEYLLLYKAVFPDYGVCGPTPLLDFLCS
jgi:hypothetical protein